MIEIMFAALCVAMVCCSVLAGFLISDRISRSQIYDSTQKTYKELEEIAVKLQAVHNENVAKIIEIQDKINALEFRTRGK
jgi:hypothetical protein